MHKVSYGLSELAYLFIIVWHDSWQEARIRLILLLIIIQWSEKINILIRLHLFIQVLQARFALNG